MSNVHTFTPEEKIELLSNPYTVHVAENRVWFSLAFKELVISNIFKPGVTNLTVFRMAGYRDELFSKGRRYSIVKRIIQEASSEDGLKESTISQRQRKKNKEVGTSNKEMRELQERIETLEQELDFLKKIRHADVKIYAKPPDASK